MTWERFKSIFFEKYFPLNVKDQKEEEFLKLEQGDMTVAQFEAKFTSLSRYAPHLVDTENRKARRFEKGLKRGIKNRLLASRLRMYAQVVERAKILEADYKEFEKEKEEQRHKRGRAEALEKNNSGGQNKKRSTLQKWMRPARRVTKGPAP
ncbi:hypothetical protein RJ639_028404 [Escallonia herrerae]|uniref:Retrotransposon gag domain-containing protein n=1 Tax=Escallonia herrerae TaxID=1293975 RepID=A0AA89BE45_9ASTE|nr:hypothetical protein RJ639_028404 [Escallonia herrerae]